MTKPARKPQVPNFSSGPCAKRPGYDVAQLDLRALGRSHRSSLDELTQWTTWADKVLVF